MLQNDMSPARSGRPPLLSWPVTSRITPRAIVSASLIQKTSS